MSNLKKLLKRLGGKRDTAEISEDHSTDNSVLKPKWSLGILNDEETDEVPGSVLLLSSVSQRQEPLGLRHSHLRTSTSSLPSPYTPNFSRRSSQLSTYRQKKRTADGTIVLEPQPEESLNDPLNWPLWRRNAALLSLGLYCMIGGGMTTVLAAGFNNVASTFHTTLPRVSLTTGLYMMGLGLGSVLMSPTAILFGKRPVYLATSIAFILSAIWCSLSPSFTSLLIARIFQGIAVSPVECLPSATVAEIFFLHERAYRLGIYTLLLLGGKNLVPLVSAVIVQNLGWRWVFGVIAFVAAFCGTLLFFFVPETFWDRTPRPKSVTKGMANFASRLHLPRSLSSRRQSKATTAMMSPRSEAVLENLVSPSILSPGTPFTPGGSRQHRHVDAHVAFEEPVKSEETLADDERKKNVEVVDFERAEFANEKEKQDTAGMAKLPEIVEESEEDAARERQEQSTMGDEEPTEVIEEESKKDAAEEIQEQHAKDDEDPTEVVRDETKKVAATEHQEQHTVVDERLAEVVEEDKEMSSETKKDEATATIDDDEIKSSAQDQDQITKSTPEVDYFNVKEVHAASTSMLDPGSPIGAPKRNMEKRTLESQPSATVPKTDLPSNSVSSGDAEKASNPNSATYTEHFRGAPAKTYIQTLKPYAGRLSQESWFRAAFRPFILYLYPAVLWSSVVYALSVGWLIVISESVSFIFKNRDSYNFNSLQTGLVYLSPFIGGILGTVVAGRVSDILVRYMSRKNGGVYEPEFRLVMGIPVALTTTIGLMGFGWSAQERDLWIVPTIFFGIISFGCTLGSTTAITFCVDSYRQFAGEALVTLNFSKNIFHGLVFSLFFTGWLEADGGKKVFVAIGGIQLICLTFTIPMYIFGKRARMWTVRRNLMEMI